jgi:hypothetical protein
VMMMAISTRTDQTLLRLGSPVPVTTEAKEERTGAG